MHSYLYRIIPDFQGPDVVTVSKLLEFAAQQEAKNDDEEDDGEAAKEGAGTLSDTVVLCSSPLTFS